MDAETQSRFAVDFPTLWVVADWIEAHCPVPDGFYRGEMLQLYPWQLWCTVNHYRVREEATYGQLATAFHYRRSQVVAPQKTGKGPWSAAMTCAEAMGPVVFAGWAEGGERYLCAENGCPCGWWYEYESGEPMGMPWPTPLIQLVATSRAQVANVYRPLKNMIKLGPLAAVAVVGEAFTRIGEDGLIEVVTSAAKSRLGNPIVFANQDETGLYLESNSMIEVADTQRRGLAGMGGRCIETTNPWDPGEDSTAKRTYESSAPDIFKYFPQAPKTLDYTIPEQRRMIHEHVYAGSTHVDLDAIEATAVELMDKDPAQAERFYGNRVVAGTSNFLVPSLWAERAEPRKVPLFTKIVLGFDGSDIDDWTAFRAETLDGYQFTPTYGAGSNARPTIWNPADYGGQVPRAEVSAALADLMDRYEVQLVYADPPYWDTEIDHWVDLYGERKIIRWYTRRLTQMHAACERLRTDVTKGDTDFAHDGCEIVHDHVANARLHVRTMDRYVLTKASPTQKIDACVTSVLAHEAAGDAIAAGMNAGDTTFHTA